MFLLLILLFTHLPISYLFKNLNNSNEKIQKKAVSDL